MHQTLVSSPLPPPQIEDSCLRGLRWRLGPYYLINQMQLHWQLKG